MQNNQENSIFIGRQPIYNKNLEIYAYELLYRSGTKNVAGVFDGNKATTTVILNAFMEFGFEHIVGHKKAFINLTRSFIDGTIPLPLSKKEVVLEILEDIPPEPEVLEQIGELRAKGYKVALDDFIFEEEMSPFISVVDMVKVDIQGADRNKLLENVKKLKNYGKFLLAEKVETLEEFEACKDMGFDFFQGYFLSKPEIIEGRKLGSAKVLLMQLLARLQDPNVQFDELEELVSRDAGLSYKLLRYINSPAVGLSMQVESIQKALLLLGLDTLKHWMTLMVIAGFCTKSDELIRIALIRAKMCELLAEKEGEERSHSYFIVGLFSILDAMLDLPMGSILKELPLHQRLNIALLKHEGDEGQALQCVTDYEEGRWDKLKYRDMQANDIARTYMEAIKWADSMVFELQKIA